MVESLDFESQFYAALKGLGLEQPKKLVEDDPTEEIETTEGDEDEEKVAEDPRPPTSINLFQHPDAHVVALDLALLRKYGPEWLEWEPETLEWRIPQDFRTNSVSSLNMGKLQAARTLHEIDTYWTQWEVFNWCTAAFNSLYADFEMLQVPTVAQCLVSVDTSKKIRTDVPWSDEVKGFLEVVFRHDGIFCRVDPITFINIDDVGLVVNHKEVEDLWPSVRKLGKAPSDDTVLAEQLRRALAVHEYLEENREQLRVQLPLVLNA